MPTAIHVTHEAIQKIGGIGAVLQGLLTSKTYLDRLRRNILVGPFWPNEMRGESRLGPGGEVLYSSLDHLYRSPLSSRLREIEQAYDVGIIYGRRKFVDKESGITSVPEVLLIDVSRFDAEKINKFKFDLWDRFGVESSRYEHVWDFEQYMRLGPPAIEALNLLGATSELDPGIIFAHEYMGVPTALAAILQPRGNYRTIFYAHEVATMRRLVEGHPGHDTMFYNVMRTALAAGHTVEDVFGSQGDYYKHSLVKASRFCDGIFAVGDYTLKEIRFLGPDFAAVDAQVTYNGVPCWKIDVAEKLRSRDLLKKYCKALLKFEPDYVFSHVTRLVPSKALWRDLRVLEHLERRLRDRNQTAVLLTLSTEVPGRRGQDIRKIESAYHWPVVHREGLPDLSGGEAHYYQFVQEFNAISRNVKVVFVNQFGFDQKVCGLRMPADMEFMDIRKGSDAEFGQSIYEPFGIAQVEPISFGGICVFTNVCGCAGFVAKAAGNQATPNAIVADYTELPDKGLQPEQMLGIGQVEREQIEDAVAAKVADDLLARLPHKSAEFEPFIERGYALASKMSWDVVARDYVIPGVERACRAQRLRQIA
jgi:glycosyltransferase involved in cell wall biosynthesis